MAVLMAAFSGCPMPSKPDGGLTVLPDGGKPVQRSEFLRAAGQCALRSSTSFQTAAHAFAANPSKQTWATAMTAWSRVEAMQFGPTASSTTPGGRDSRDQIYSWPLVSRCAVEETLTADGYSGDVGALLINRRGLAAAEVLLFTNPDEVTCGNTAAWMALTPTERAARKQAAAAAIALDVQTRADALVAAWGPFVETLATAGPGNSTYPTVAGALNRVSDSVFFLDAAMKDAKLAGPLGLKTCTATPPCLDLLESQYAKHNTANLRGNLLGLRELMEGCDDASFNGIGFDDLIDAQGAFSVTTRLDASLQAAQVALDALDEPDLSESLVSDPASVRAVYDALKGVTDLMKSEFLTVLDVELPMGLEGDND
ncbi:MAG: imelysin family protein [Archangium sp.]|nr:imelysin family protein [Archangium sp.]